jgi:transposase
MKIVRSTKCTLNSSTTSKKKELEIILKEYSNVVNFFIKHFWNKKITKKDLTKNVFNLPDTWLSSRMKQVAAREALDMIKSTDDVIESNKEMIALNISAMESKIEEIKTRENTRQNRRKINNLHCKIKKNQMKHDMMQPQKPKHRGKRMCLSALICNLQENKESHKFNFWLHLSSIGNKMSLDLPIVFHRHYKELQRKGNRLNSYIVTKDNVQFVFEIETGPKKKVKHLTGIDSGINALASTSNGNQIGTDIKEIIYKIKRCKHGSKRQKRLREYLKQRMNETAKELVKNTDLLVVEKLKNLNKNSKLKERKSKNFRSVIGIWMYRYWLQRLEMCCEDNRVSFRTISPYNTSVQCSRCGYADKTNRNGKSFKCKKCCHTCNADLNAALNILKRFVTGKYGSCYKAWFIENFENVALV